MQKISIVGFGKIGQAVGANILQHGLKLNAVDINFHLAGIFASGQYYTNEPQLTEILQNGFEQGVLTISNDFSSVRGSAAIIVCIPLLVDEQKKILKQPFLDCFSQLVPHLSDQCIVSDETTVPVGFTRREILPALESAGMKHGKDFYLVHSPERIKSGSMLKQLNTTIKVVGGIDQNALMAGVEIYKKFIPADLVQPVNNVETAEMVKLAGMVYRDINIALANQLAQFAHCLNMDITEIIRLTNTDGEAFILDPGIGVGGHCTPVYPYFLIDNFRQQGMDFSLAKSARAINDAMALFAIDEINKRGVVKSVLLLGLGFRPEVREDIFSTTYLLKERLQQLSIQTYLHDPCFSLVEMQHKGFQPVEDIYAIKTEAVILVTAHAIYKEIDWKRLAANGCRYVLDGRNMLSANSIRSTGLEYIGIGRP
jgi:nucleotide sugar dehydrogenase